MEGTKNSGRHARYRAKRKEVEDKKMMELESLKREIEKHRQFYEYMFENHFFLVARYEMLREEEENSEAWRQTVENTDEILQSLRLK